MTTGQYADRRSGHDRRTIQQFRPGTERRSGFDRRAMQTEPGILALRGNTEFRQDVQAAGRERAERCNALATLYPPSTRDFLAGVGTVLTQLVAGFYDASMDPKLWPEVLAKLRDAVHADNAAVVSHDFEVGQGQLNHSVGIDAMFVTAYREFYSRQNVWLQQAEKLRSMVRC